MILLKIYVKQLLLLDTNFNVLLKSKMALLKRRNFYTKPRFFFWHKIKMILNSFLYKHVFCYIR